MLFRVLFLCYFIHIYHLFSKIKLQATWGQRQKLRRYIPWSIKLLDTELLLNKLTIQFANLWVYGGMCTYHWAWRSKTIVFNLSPGWDNSVLVDWPSPRKMYIFFQLEQLKWPWVEELDHQPCIGQKQHWIISPRLSQRHNQLICSLMGELVIHGQSPWTN